MSTSRVRVLSEVLLKNPRYVNLNRDRAERVAQILRDFDIAIPKWDYSPFYPQLEDFEDMCLFYLIFNSINYCYFDQDGKKFQDGNLSGSSLASVRLTEKWDEIKDPQFLRNVDENYLLSELFQAESPISLVKERTAALREVGDFLSKNPEFTFDKLFRRFKQNAYFVSQALPTFLPTWRDPFFKRSQLFVGMVYGRFQTHPDLPIQEESLQDLTVFADYRVPQTLIAMGIIEPHARILTRLHSNRFLGSGSRKELELRAATILGADLITDKLRNLVDEDINSLHTDFLLWAAARKIESMPKDLFSKPWPNHHLTITTDY
jgi:hypothetical protein